VWLIAIIYEGKVSTPKSDTCFSLVTWEGVVQKIVRQGNLQMKEELSGTGFIIFGDRVNILQIFQVYIIVSPTNDTRLVLN
jgi:hypothetical protein